MKFHEISSLEISDFDFTAPILRAVEHCQWLAMYLELLAGLSWCMGGEAHGCARQPYGRFDLSRRP